MESLVNIVLEKFAHKKFLTFQVCHHQLGQKWARKFCKSEAMHTTVKCDGTTKSKEHRVEAQIATSQKTFATGVQHCQRNSRSLY